jgi:hypothetical protein
MSDTLYQTINTDALHRRALPDRIAPSLYYDPALFEAELERIFYKTWIWVAHESELPNSGDFPYHDDWASTRHRGTRQERRNERFAEPLPPSWRDRLRGTQRQRARLYLPLSQLVVCARRYVARVCPMATATKVSARKTTCR